MSFLSFFLHISASRSPTNLVVRWYTSQCWVFWYLNCPFKGLKTTENSVCVSVWILIVLTMQMRIFNVHWLMQKWSYTAKERHRFVFQCYHLVHSLLQFPTSFQSIEALFNQISRVNVIPLIKTILWGGSFDGWRLLSGNLIQVKLNFNYCRN